MLRTQNAIPKKRFVQPIAVINQSTVVTDAQAKAVVHAMQVQISRDFAPAWNILGELHFFGKNDAVPTTYWQMVLLDDADQAGVLGYHDLTPEGLPLGRVFIKTAVAAKVAWSVTLSHELLEMLVDPYADLLCLVQRQDGLVALFPVELCDPVEGDTYAIGSTLVSNFVYPEWFENYAKNADGKYDFLGTVNAPFQLAPGGYMSAMKLTQAIKWTQFTAMGESMAPDGSRMCMNPACGRAVMAAKALADAAAAKPVWWKRLWRFIVES